MEAIAIFYIALGAMLGFLMAHIATTNPDPKTRATLDSALLPIQWVTPLIWLTFAAINTVAWPLFTPYFFWERRHMRKNKKRRKDAKR